MGKNEYILIIIIFNFIFIVFILGIVNYIRQYRNKKKNHEAELKNKEIIHRQELLTTQLEIQTQTMQHIGREIHDNVGQKLTLASLYTQQLGYENKAPQVNDKIESISHIINESLTELRQLSKSLTDDTINNTGITQLLQQECDKVNDLKKCKVSFSSNEKIPALTYKVKSILLRITQEFLQNSIKHSNCVNIMVELTTNEDLLQLLMKDDGNGFDAAAVAGNGIGLSNIKKRTALIGGSLSLESSAGKGCSLHLTLPLQNIIK